MCICELFKGVGGYRDGDHWEGGQPGPDHNADGQRGLGGEGAPGAVVAVVGHVQHHAGAPQAGAVQDVLDSRGHMTRQGGRGA